MGGTPEVMYEDEGVVLYCADARDVLPGLPTESVHLVVADPPYGVGWRSGFRHDRFDSIANDQAADRGVVAEILTHCVRLVAQKRHLYVFGPVDVLEGLKVSAVAELVWDKGRPGAGDLTGSWGPQHERINFMVSLHRHGGQSGTDRPPVRMRKGSVLRYSPPTGRKVRHPSEKPVPLLLELVESSSRQGEVVLDPVAGVCSTGVAAMLSGRKAILVESDRGYCDIGVERLTRAAQLVKQTRVA